MVLSAANGIMKGGDERVAAGEAGDYQVLADDDDKPSAPSSGGAEASETRKRKADSGGRGSFAFVADVASFLSGKSSRKHK